jgi:SagB-type dehydrogenase family enzyme
VRKQSHRAICLVLVILLACTISAFAQELKTIQLPEPRTTGGRPLMEVLKDRHSSREFSDQELPLPVLSDMLWAAFGINRPDVKKRTAPSAVNWQEVDIYVATATGLFLYDAEAHALHQILSDDIREMTGAQAFVKDAPVNLVYVADYAKMGERSEDDKRFYSGADVGFIGQNVYLFCASEGLATVIRGSVDRTPLAEVMNLRPEQHIVLSQTVGYPKKIASEEN